MGHHQDDNVETALWRFSSGARGVGLAGISQLTNIPECHGLYGISESGSSYMLQSKEKSSRGARSLSPGEKDIFTDTRSGSAISTGGILVFRPLLSFPKSSLVATCLAHNISFVSDPTNFDVTLTPRNAIRHLLSRGGLPRGLQKPSILSMINEAKNLLRELTKTSEKFLRKCKVQDLNLRSGTITIQFPPVNSWQYVEGSKEERMIHEIRTLMLRRIAELVSALPGNHFPLKSFEPFVNRLFLDPLVEHAISKRYSPKETVKREAFTVGGVMFLPLEPQNTELARGEPLKWLLSRQPFMRNRLPTLRLDLDVPALGRETSNTLNINTNTANATSQATAGTDSGSDWTQWSLWDDRYWFRLSIARTESSIDGNQDEKNKERKIRFKVRPLQPPDLRDIYASLDAATTYSKSRPLLSARLKETLSREAPRHVRFTLPLIVMEMSDSGSGAVKEIPLALPTIGVRLPESHSLPYANSYKLECEWMYKMIDSEVLKSLKLTDSSTNLDACPSGISYHKEAREISRSCTTAKE